MASSLWQQLMARAEDSDLINWLLIHEDVICVSSSSSSPIVNAFAIACNDNNIMLCDWFHMHFWFSLSEHFEKEFYKACGRGSLLVAQWLYAHHHQREQIDIKHASNIAIQNGQLNVLEWMAVINNDKPTIVVNNDNFDKACECGHLAIAKWMHSYCPTIEKTNAFIKTCERGHLNVIRWLLNGVIVRATYTLKHLGLKHACSRGQLEVVQHLLPTVIIHNYQELFETACISGHLNVVKYIHELMIQNNDVIFLPSLFEKVCERGHLPIVQWMFALTHVLPTELNVEFGFCSACFNKHQHICKWIVDNHTFVNSSGLNVLFAAACGCGLMDVAKQMLTKYSSDIDIHFENNAAFVSACKHGHLNVAQWLFTMTPVMSFVNDRFNEGFVEASTYGHLPVVKWIHNTCADSYMLDYTGAFCGACQHGHQNVAQWFCQLYPNKYHFDVVYTTCDANNHVLVYTIVDSLSKHDLCGVELNKPPCENINVENTAQTCVVC